MGVLIDYNQVVLSTLFASIGNHTNITIEESMIRAMFLNVIRSIRRKYCEEYGEIVVCADGKNSWRKSVYPYYKASRKKSRDASDLDWEHLFNIMNTIREELKEYFPYKIIHLDHVEADDVIGVLCHEFGNPMNTGEKFLIYSSDKDYIQLHVYGNVKQINPISKKWISNSDPENYLIEHILKGDTGDGIPNVLSPDNTIVINERQKPMTVKRLNLFKNEANMDETTRTRFYRNRMLIDLTYTPQHHKDDILTEYAKKSGDRSKLFHYFIDKGLRNLIEDIQGF